MLSDAWDRILAWSGSIVSPDWGGLVAMIPALLLAVVVAFLAVTTAKWLSAGPTRRGAGRRPPVGPDGRPLHAPVIAPIAIAVGAFMAAFGLVAGAAWLAGGIAVVLVGIVGLKLAGRRDRASGEARPGGLTTARAVVIGAAVIVIVAVAATAKVVPDAPDKVSLPTIPPGTPGPTLPSADLILVAAGITFHPQALVAPADRPFAVAFDNQDNVPHNLEIRDASGKLLFMGDVMTGPAVVVYDVPALAAGEYPFICTVHPGMTGTLTVK